MLVFAACPSVPDSNALNFGVSVPPILRTPAVAISSICLRLRSGLGSESDASATNDCACIIRAVVMAAKASSLPSETKDA